MDNRINKAEASLNLALEAVNRDRQKKVRFQRETWMLIAQAIELNGIKVVCAEIRMDVTYAKSRMEKLKIHTGAPQGSKNKKSTQVQMANDFAVVDFPHVVASPQNDVKIRLSIGGQQILIEGQSKTFDWSRFLQSMESISC